MAGTHREHDRVMRELEKVLHDMCQPLTALYCSLEIGQQNEKTATPEGTALWKDCLRECERLTKSVSTMRVLLQQAQTNEHGRSE